MERLKQDLQQWKLQEKSLIFARVGNIIDERASRPTYLHSD